MSDSDAERSTTRLSKDDRREQLLDVAAELLVAKGATAVTMERVAEWAGVSKALPYAHFENAPAVLLALRDRETSRVAALVWEAAEQAPAGSRVADTVTAFFDAVGDRTELLGMLAGPSAVVRDTARAEERIGPSFVAGLLSQFFDLAPDQAHAAAAVVLGALIGAADGWGAGEASREAMTAIVAVTMQAVLDASATAVPAS